MYAGSGGYTFLQGRNKLRSAANRKPLRPATSW
jgi:hypothetical protein